MKSTKISPVNVEAGIAAGQPTLHSSNPAARRTRRNLLTAAILSLLLISGAQKESSAQSIAAAPAYVELNALQLDQLVAPIALDPDPLVAQILTGSTFPDQVGDADRWLNQNLKLTLDQRGSEADGMSWDASVKGLVVFPAILDSMSKNTAWTTQLGNAYFNQPTDVMNAIQAMRLEAQRASLLVTTRYEKVLFVADVIEIVPVNPAVVFVPYYNPWRIWSADFVAYPGYVELPPPAGVVVSSDVAFEPAVNVGAYAQFGWGFSSWAPSWGDGTVACNNNTYISNSGTVANHGYFGGHDRGVFERAGRGVPAGYHAGAHAGAARYAGRYGHSGPSFGRGAERRPTSYGRSPYSGQRTPYGHSYAPSRTSGNGVGRNVGGSRANPVRRTNSPRPYTSMNHSTPTNRTVGRTTPGARYGSNARSTMVGHSTASGRSFGGGRTVASGGRSSGYNHAPTQSRSYAANRSMSGPTSSGRSFGTSSSIGRSNAANRPVSRPGSTGNSFGANRSMNRPASYGANRPMNRPASMGNSFAGNRSISRPASIGRSGGGGFGRAPMAGGRKH
jgi:hypothetical protein